jgi:hypothetical protein
MYLVDSDVLIDAKNQHYAFDILPAFWRWLAEAHDNGRVYTVQAVADEINAGDDELSAWMKHQPTSFKIVPDQSDVPSLARVSQWASTSGFAPGAVSTFLGVADYFLVAQALTRGYIVVTKETVANPNTKQRIKIPNACQAVGVRCVTLFQMLKAEQVSFG